MLLVNLIDGHTHRIDLANPSNALFLQTEITHNRVTGITLQTSPSPPYTSPKNFYLIQPKKFKPPITFGAELVLHKITGEVVGERVWVQAENVRSSMALFHEKQCIRCDLVKIDKISYNQKKEQGDG